MCLFGVLVSEPRPVGGKLQGTKKGGSESKREGRGREGRVTKRKGIGCEGAGLVAHDELELARAELAVCVAEGAVARDAREVRRRDVDPRCKVLVGFDVTDTGRGGG